MKDRDKQLADVLKISWVFALHRSPPHLWEWGLYLISGNVMILQRQWLPSMGRLMSSFLTFSQFFFEDNHPQRPNYAVWITIKMKYDVLFWYVLKLGEPQIA